MKQTVLVIGGGFAGLAAASCLAKAGYRVTLVEKNKTLGGRARAFSAEGFTFDMGPSWYWMPDVFEHYFGLFDHSPADFYQLQRLDPSYRVYFGKDDALDLPASLPELYALFNSLEPGSGQGLEQFLQQAAYKYQVGMQKLVYKPGRSLREFMSVKLLLDVLRLDVFKSLHGHARKFFSHPQLLQLVEFPVLFLGATPQNTPALYSLMNWADMGLGTWYPMGGMFKIVEGMEQVAREQGVEIITDCPVHEIVVEKGVATKVVTARGDFTADVVVAGADYHHVEQELMEPRWRSYGPGYWKKRTMAPSSLLFYLGINKRLKNLQHHNLFFDKDFGRHAREIYEQPAWPSDPLFYACVPSQTDASVAPQGSENLFLLVPVAPGLEDSEEIREHYYGHIMDRLEALSGQSVRDAVVYKRSYAHRDFVQDYNAFRGNAYGLANTLRQTALLKPALKSKRVKNLYYTGQLTVPGPGVPPSLISGQVVASEIEKDFAS
jgi:phytoene desaturase